MTNCKAPDCERRAKVKGFCHKHYMRMYRNGDLDVRKADDGAPMALLKASVDYQGEECLIWPFALNHGYGYLEVEKGRNMHAHRYMCILAHGEPPFESAHAAHNCGKGSSGCFAPNHLRWATKNENEYDKVFHDSLPRGETHQTAKLTNAQALEIAQDDRVQDVIAAVFGVSQAVVSNIKTGKTWSSVTGIKPTKTGPNRGTKCRTVKLTNDQALAIAKDNRSAYKIASEYDVSPQVIYDIRWGRNWSWLTGIKRKAA